MPSESKTLNLNANRVIVGGSYMPKSNIDFSTSDPTYKVSVNGIVPDVQLDLSQDYTGDNNHTGNLNYEGDNTHSGTNVYTGTSTFGNDAGSGGIGETYHWGQVHFEDSSVSGDPGLPAQSLCRTATNKMTTYNLLADDFTFTGDHTYQGNSTHSGTNGYTATSTFGQILPEDGGIGQCHFHGGCKFFNSCLSGDAAQPSKTMCITASDKLTSYDLLADDFTFTGDHTNSGTVTMSALTASTGLALDSNKNIISGSSGVGLGDANAWTGTNSYSQTSTHTNDIIMTTGNLDVEDGDLWVAGTFQVDSTSNINGDLYKAKSDKPASASAQGSEGEIRWDDDGGTYIYVCVATDTWMRASLATW